MTTTYYILRANYFAYNDEYYTLDNYSEYGYGKISGVSSSLEEITKHWQDLELKAQGDLAFSELQFLIDMPEDACEPLNAFFMEACGRPFFKACGYDTSVKSCKELYELLTPEKGLQFLQLAGICRYTLVKAEIEGGVYVAKHAKTQQYVFTEAIDGDYHDEDRAAIVYASAPDELIGLMAAHGNPSPWHLTDGLLTITDSPALLEAVIATNPNIKYDQKARTLKIDNADGDAMRAIYPLLREKPFLIEKILPQHLLELQVAHEAELM